MWQITLPSFIFLPQQLSIPTVLACPLTFLPLVPANSFLPTPLPKSLSEWIPSNWKKPSPTSPLALNSVRGRPAAKAAHLPEPGTPTTRTRNPRRHEPYPPRPRCGLYGHHRKRPAGFPRGSRQGTSSGSPGVQGHGPAAPASPSWRVGGGGGESQPRRLQVPRCTFPQPPGRPPAVVGSDRIRPKAQEILGTEASATAAALPSGSCSRSTTSAPPPSGKHRGTASNYQSREAQRKEPVARPSCDVSGGQSAEPEEAETEV